MEDDDAIGRTLETVLVERGYVVTWCREGGAALTAADTERPDLVLLDLGLPGIDGIDVCRRLRRGSPLVPILILTARDAEMDVVLGLSAGADDYVLKPFRLGELLARVAANLRRVEASNGGRTLRIGDLEIDTAARSASRAGGQLEIRPREFDLLVLLARNAGRVVTRERILAELWRDHWGGASKTLDMHISTLRRRLGEPDPITTLRRIGYRFDAP